MSRQLKGKPTVGINPNNSCDERAFGVMQTVR